MMLMALGMMVGVQGVGAVEAAPQIQVTGPWQVTMSAGSVTINGRKISTAKPAILAVKPAELIEVKDERYDSLPLFNNDAAPWTKGAKLKGLVTMETTAAGMLLPESLVLKSAPGAAPLKQGKDYALEGQWATFGRLAGGAIGENQPVYADYQFGRGRIDSIVVDVKGNVSLLRGVPDNATPHPPDPGVGQAAIANLWIPGRLAALTNECLYPILEAHYPEPAITGPPPAATLLPKTWAKLQAKQPVAVLAWGDSVTAGGQASDEAHRYQNQFVTLLQKRFPDSRISLTTVGWGGRNSDNFLNEPPGSPYNFEEKVLKPHPDLVVMEFVNDAYLTPAQVEERYSKLLQRFQASGIEWIILTPHYVRPDWMGAKTARIETDPRPYVLGLREFAARHHVALADASLRWGHLLKEGIPYVTLLSNSINHPDDRGHELFAQSLMELFGG